jgi:hypothetical protein
MLRCLSGATGYWGSDDIRRNPDLFFGRFRVGGHGIPVTYLQSGPLRAFGRNVKKSNTESPSFFSTLSRHAHGGGGYQIPGDFLGRVTARVPRAHFFSESQMFEYQTGNQINQTARPGSEKARFHAAFSSGRVVGQLAPGETSELLSGILAAGWGSSSAL